MVSMNYKIIVASLIVVITGVILFCARNRSGQLRKFPPQAEPMLDGFKSARQPDITAYDDLFRYFLEGFETTRSKRGALAYYKGLPSRHGLRVDALEGFSRSAPLWAAWVNSGRPHSIQLMSGRIIDLEDEFRQGLLVGTDPAADEYWGDVAYKDQRIVEASDIALSVWLFRDSVWTNFSEMQKSQVARWLKQSVVHKVADNNWHLFPVFIGVVLNALKVPSDNESVIQNYARFKEFYRGDGWFSDGPGQTFDYYNAWAIHYQLYWLQQVNPEWDSEFITATRRKFLATYQFLLGPSGFPILGRSVCYRMAAAAPLVFGQQSVPNDVSSAKARRALDATWAYFIQRGAVKEGNVSQGYCVADPRILDNYSGPASCLWALRSLIVAYYNPPLSPFWTASGGHLPVEEKSYEIQIPVLSWTVIGDKSNGTIIIKKPGDDVGGKTRVREFDWLHRLASAFSGRPLRPENIQAKYDRNFYSSAVPFCGCLGRSD
jgi:hypothetical protein